VVRDVVLVELALEAASPSSPAGRPGPRRLLELLAGPRPELAVDARLEPVRVAPVGELEHVVAAVVGRRAPS
jgi:hypothetical protein